MEKNNVNLIIIIHFIHSKMNTLKYSNDFRHISYDFDLISLRYLAGLISRFRQTKEMQLL